MTDAQVIVALWVLWAVAMVGFGWCLWEWTRMTRVAQRLSQENMRLREERDEAVRLVVFVRGVNRLIGDGEWSGDDEYSGVVRQWMADADRAIANRNLFS